jgi:hypothetical protein
VPTATATSTFTAADINRAGVVTVFDLSEVLTGCGTNNANADLNCDGTIQRVDLSSLLI